MPAFLLTGDSKAKGELGVEVLSLEVTPGCFVLSLLKEGGHECMRRGRRKV